MGRSTPAGRAWRRVTTLGILCLLALIAAAITSMPMSSPETIGDDWRWYGDGAARLLSAEPLYDPAYLAGPYDLGDPRIEGTFNQWAAFAVTLLPLQLALPEWTRQVAWALLMAAMLLAAFALVWPHGGPPLSSLALALALLVAPPTWVALWMGNVACAVALGVALAIVGQRRGSLALMSLGLLLAGLAKILPAVPLVLWLLVRHRAWRPVAVAVGAGLALSAVAIVIEGPRLIGDFVVASSSQLPLELWTNVAPARLLEPLLGDLARPASLAAAAALVVMGLRPRTGDGPGLLCLTTASCLVMPTTHIFWLLSPLIVALAYFGDQITRSIGLVIRWEPTR